MAAERSESLSFRVVGAFAGTALGAILTFAFQATAARHLNAVGFGEFAYASTLLNIGGLLAPLGFQVAILKYMSQYRIFGNDADSAALLRTARRSTLAGAAIVAALIAFTAWINASGGLISVATLVLACAVPFSALTKIEAARLRANGHTTLSVFLEVPMREGAAFVLLVVVILAGRVDALSVAACYIVAVALAFSAAASRYSGEIAPAVVPARSQREWWSVATSALLSTAALLVLRRMDIVIVGSVAGYAEAGIYAAAARIADVIQLPLVAATVVASPKVAELYAQNRLVELQNLVGKVGLFAFTLSFIGSVPVLLAPAQILKLFGAEFVAGEAALRWLVAGQLFNALTSCAAVLLTMTGHEWRTALITASVGFVAVAANWFLALHSGMLGVAIGTCGSLIVWNLLLCIVGYQKTRIFALPILRTRVTAGI